MSKFARHLPQGKSVTCKNDKGEEDVFVLQPLPWSEVSSFFDIMKVMGSGKIKKEELEKLSEEEAGAMFLEKFSADTIKKIQEMVLATLKVSYPEEDDEITEKFAAAHMWEFFPVIMELNASGMDKMGQDNVKGHKRSPE